MKTLNFIITLIYLSQSIILAFPRLKKVDISSYALRPQASAISQLVQYENPHKRGLNAQDAAYINTVMLPLERSNAVSHKKVSACRIMLDRAIMAYGLYPVWHALLPKKLNKRGLDLKLGLKRKDLSRYADAILELEDDISLVEEKTQIIMDPDFIENEKIEHPFLPNKEFFRIKNPRLAKTTFTLGHKLWGKFEMFIEADSDGGHIYVAPAIDDITSETPREYFCFNMDLGSASPLIYVCDERQIALDALVPAAYIGEKVTIDMARIIGILREVVAFREEVVKHSDLYYHWFGQIPGNGIVSFDILAEHRKLHMLEFLNTPSRMADFYATDRTNQLKVLAEFGRHRPDVLGRKLSASYYLLVLNPFAEERADVNVYVPDRFILSVSMSDRDVKNDEVFAASARTLVQRFLKRLNNKGTKFPRVITVEDTYFNKQISFTIDRTDRVRRRRTIRKAGKVRRFRTISDKGLREVLLNSEKILERRTRVMDMSKVSPPRLLAYGYTKVAQEGGSFMIAPVKGQPRRELPESWVRDLPFSGDEVAPEAALAANIIATEKKGLIAISQSA